ncbi:MAG: sensor histidine kinase [Suilimivivens sp.]
MITGIIALALILSGILFYIRTYHTLRSTYQSQMLQQLDTTMNQINEQIDLIDSLYILFMSNNLIYDSLDSITLGSDHTALVEKQMTYLLITNYVWKEQFINSVSIYANSGHVYRVSTIDSSLADSNSQKIYQNMDHTYPSLMLTTLDSDNNSLYFVRNIFSSNTGFPIATMVISVDRTAWMNYLGSSLGNGWFIYLYNKDIELFSQPNQGSPIEDSNYFTVSETLRKLDLSAVVVAPRDELMEKLNSSLQVYLIMMLIIIIFVLVITFALSKAITHPITRIKFYVNRIAEGHYDEIIPPTEMYEEFDSLTHAFNNMLNEINAYHADNLEKQLLLKNAEIQSLQSQINPHFMFNTLNTLAWKAQMSDNPELYQMVISLGELLKTNVVSRTSSYIPLQEELKYIKFYIYLQKMRFEDKINAVFDISPNLQDFQIPCFSIQSLVENSFVHGLEPKKGNGELSILIHDEDDYITIIVRDNGIGFQEIPNIANIKPSSKDSHTHIGLCNLNRRLFLLYGEEAQLHISSIPGIETVVSFHIPRRRK